MVKKNICKISFSNSLTYIFSEIAYPEKNIMSMVKLSSR